MGMGWRRYPVSSGLYCSQPPTALPWPGQDQDARKLEMLLWPHQLKSPSFQKFSPKEKKKKAQRVLSFRRKPKGFLPFSWFFFQNLPTVLYKRLCNLIFFWRGGVSLREEPNHLSKIPKRHDAALPLIPQLLFFFFFPLTEKYDFVKHSDVDGTSFSDGKCLP